jgi:hypothetical protein
MVLSCLEVDFDFDFERPFACPVDARDLVRSGSAPASFSSTKPEVSLGFTTFFNHAFSTTHE